MKSPKWQAMMQTHLNLTYLDECADLLAPPAAAGRYQTSVAAVSSHRLGAAPPRDAKLSATSGVHIRHPCVGFVYVGEGRRHERQASASNQHLH